jgi:hypothetical protein
VPVSSCPPHPPPPCHPPTHTHHTPPHTQAAKKKKAAADDSDYSSDDDLPPLEANPNRLMAGVEQARTVEAAIDLLGSGAFWGWWWWCGSVWGKRGGLLNVI